MQLHELRLETLKNMKLGWDLDTVDHLRPHSSPGAPFHCPYRSSRRHNSWKKSLVMFWCQVRWEELRGFQLDLYAVRNAGSRDRARFLKQKCEPQEIRPHNLAYHRSRQKWPPIILQHIMCAYAEVCSWKIMQSLRGTLKIAPIL